jgi:hypothetical protein
VERCAHEIPQLEPVNGDGHVSACWESSRLPRAYEPTR